MNLCIVFLKGGDFNMTYGKDGEDGNLLAESLDARQGIYQKKN